MTTYAQLTQQLQDWAEDDGTEFLGSIDEMVANAHSRVARDLDLSIFSAILSASTSIGSANLTKPTVVAGTKGLSFSGLWYTLSGTAIFMQKRSHDFVRDYGIGATSGPPRYYAELSETTWLLAPTPAAIHAVSCRVMIDPAPLSGTVTNTWIGDTVPDLLFKACLAEAEGFLKADDRFAIWKQEYIELLTGTKRKVYPLLESHYELTPMEVPAQPTPQR